MEERTSAMEGMVKCLKNVGNMSEEENVSAMVKQVLPQILDLFDTVIEAGIELISCVYNNNNESTQTILTDMLAVTDAISIAQVPIAAVLQHSYTEEMLDNIQDTLNSIQQLILNNEIQNALIKIEFQLLPFLKQAQNAFYYWGMVYPDQEKMKEYYTYEFAEHYKSPYFSDAESAQYQVSIVIPAYNHLEITKRCLESVLHTTDFNAYNAELILIDHGSTDGTLDYFKSIGATKIIHYKRNIRGAMFCAIPLFCEGEFIAILNNDIIVTKDWLNILLTCLKSDENIFSVTPTTPNIANLQSINFPTQDPDEFVKWANQQNKSSPCRWNDRARIMPNAVIYRAKLLNNIGFWDPLFYLFDFSDDDLSLRARRAGYRQIVCDDVACYHFGSVTQKKAQTTEDSLTVGRNLFFKKNGIDAWGTGFCYDYNAVQLIMQDVGQTFRNCDINVLGIDCGFGDTLLQIKNLMRSMSCNCNLISITTQQEYTPDLCALSDKFFFGEPQKYLESIESFKFSYIYIGRYLEEYDKVHPLLNLLSEKISSNGQLIFSCTNPFFIKSLEQFLSLSISPEIERISFCNIEGLVYKLKLLYNKIKVIPVISKVEGVDCLIKSYYKNATVASKAKYKNMMSTQYYYIICSDRKV